MLRENYFDNASTTPLDPRVLEAMLPYLNDDFGNAHSIHQLGLRARAGVEKAREQVGAALGNEPGSVYFTSGATEANNWVISLFDSGIISPFEHSSVRIPALASGFTVADFEKGLPKGPVSVEYELQAVMAVSNEFGRWWNGPSIGGAHFLCDATQGLGKLDVALFAADFKTASGHKIYGPKGVGVVSTEQEMDPLFLGGGQELGMRAGTLNVPGIVGFGKACEIAMEEREKNWNHAELCRNAVLKELESVSDWQVNGVFDENLPASGNVPHILSLSFLGLQGETLVVECDNHGFAISAGPACSSESKELSPSLLALGLSPQWAEGSVRLSFGKFNTPESAARLGKVLASCANSLRNRRT